MKSRRMIVLLVVCSVLSLLSAQARTEAAPPSGVPDLTDPAVLAKFAPVGLSRLGDDPDFPVLLLANLGEGVPQFLLVILDARNGKKTWSLREDAAVFYLLFVDRTTIQQAFLDEGFAGGGQPSGKFIAGGPDTAEELMARVREGYLRYRGLARLGAVI